MVEIPASIQHQTKAAIQGNQESLGVVFLFYRPRLLAHAFRICGNTQNAQDAVQDTFISAFTHLQSLRDVNLFYPWLKKILVNHCYKLVRRDRFTELTDHHLSGDLVLHRSIDEHFEKISNRQRVYEALRFLSDELRSCVMLRFFSDYKSYEEIALVLGIPVGTVRSRLAAARQKLSALFSRTDDAGEVSLKEAQQWSGYYFHQWNNLHIDLNTRNEFLNHLLPSLQIRFTSGKQGIGREIIEGEINNDLIYGSSVIVDNVVSSGNISIVEARNINNPEYPDRCAPTMAIVFFRNGGKVETTHIFDSPRP